jgi:hypothetical protein
MASMDHRAEIERMRAQIAGLLAEKPPRRKRADEISYKLNRLIQLQLKREGKILRKLHERRVA